MTGAAARQQFLYGLWLGGVVEQQQPVMVLLQPGPHRRHRRLLWRIVGQLEVGGQGGSAGEGAVIAQQGRRRLGPHPPDQVVVGPLPVGILHSKLGLTNPTKARQRHPPNRKV